jgi:uncharacterized protein YndB with AHSA1/START domain
MSLKDDVVTLEETFNAPVEDVWRAWTAPKIILKWFGSDPHGKGLSATLDVQKDGSFEITFHDGDKTEHTCSGIYSEVKEYSRLSFSWQWRNEPGVVSFVSIDFHKKNNATQMLFTHRNLGSESRHNYEQGWRSTFEKLKTILADNKNL